MKALLIAGGLGTRLRPLTYTRPKHLLPIANRAHVEHVFDLLLRHEIHDVVLLTSYLADAFAAVIENAGERGLKVEIAHETEPLGTGGAVKNAEHLVGGETIFAFNGDILTSADLGRLLAFHRDRGAAATLLVSPVDDPSAFGVVATDSVGRAERFIEKPTPGEAPTNNVSVGVYVLEPSVLASIPEGRVVSIEREVFPQLAADGALYAHAQETYWMDVGTPQKYLQANLDALSGLFRTDAVARPGPGVSLVAPSAKVSDSARVSSACLGDGCSVAAGASVTESVLLGGVVVAEDARILRSCLGEGVRVGPGVELVDQAVADGESIESQGGPAR